jgi:NitT/TauT family transport system substrate-binding protein
MTKQSTFVSHLLFATALAMSGMAHAEVSELKVAEQYGIGYLPIMVMEDQKLVEKEARALGLDLKVSYIKLAAGNVMNDALLSGTLHFASGGVTPLITLWSRTQGNLEVKAVGALDSMPLMLNSRNPKVKTVGDLTEQDKIALPAVKISIQAVTLQMAAEKMFGEANRYKFDTLTVSMSHPDGQAALLSGQGEIDAQFSAPPFQYQQLAKPGIHTVLNSYDVTGGPATFNVVWTTGKFRSENPKAYEAFVKALQDAIDIISRDRKAAAELYLRVSKDKDSVQDILAMLNNPQIEFTMTPKNVMKYADFMAKSGSIKVKPASWKDLFFPNVHSLPGS